MHIPFNNTFITLGDQFYTRVKPTAVVQPSLIRFNDELAQSLGIEADPGHEDKLAEIFSGNAIATGADPLAMAYAGHQFGYFNPQMGDGRAILLGEVDVAGEGSVHVQLKGCGRTHYSRNGDGRAALGPVLREYLLSEAMAKLGVPTTRALAAVTTGETVARESLLSGGVITRVATSFVRVGTFQYFSSRDEVTSLKRLADYVMMNNYPEAVETEQPYISLFQEVIKRQAHLIAQWMQLGFIHGVMNTDNMSVAGETIDYGPCAFMDTYAHDQVFSSIDREGRYAYDKQPGMGLWNLMRLGEAMLPLIANKSDEAVDIAQTLLKSYIVEYEQAWLSAMRAKLGLSAVDKTEQDDKALIEALLALMESGKADFTLTFFYLSKMNIEPDGQDNHCRHLFDQPAEFDRWAIKWRQRLQLENTSDAERQREMLQVNPVYIPRNHQIEAAIQAAEHDGDFSVFHQLHEVLQQPFVQQQGQENYQQAPQPQEVVYRTFCGT